MWTNDQISHAIGPVNRLCQSVRSQRHARQLLKFLCLYSQMAHDLACQRPLNVASRLEGASISTERIAFNRTLQSRREHSLSAGFASCKVGSQKLTAIPLASYASYDWFVRI